MPNGECLFYANKKKKNLKVVCDCSTAVAMDVLNVLLNILI